MTVRTLSSIVGGTKNLEIEYNQNDPPIVFFDTSIWRGMNDEGGIALQNIQQKHGFRYRYSIINFVELVSHLDDQASAHCRYPFRRFQSYFCWIHKLCERDILPSPEEVLLASADLSHYIDPIWIVDAAQMALAVERIISVDRLAELTGEEETNTKLANGPRYIVRPSHYRELRGTDGNSMRSIMQELEGFKRPLEVDDKLVNWFTKLCHFFLFVRPTNGKLLQNVTKEEQHRFGNVLTKGGGRLFQAHCTALVKKTVDGRRRVDPNDLYDMLQLILLENNNAIFVASEKTFFCYDIDQNEPKRVLHWTDFVSAV